MDEGARGRRNPAWSALPTGGRTSVHHVSTHYPAVRTRSQAHSRNPNVGCLLPEDVGFGVDLYDFWHGECGNGCRYQPCRGIPLSIKHWTAPKRRVQECASIGQRRNGVFKTDQTLDNAETASGTCVRTKDPNRCSHDVTSQRESYAFAGACNVLEVYHK